MKAKTPDDAGSMRPLDALITQAAGQNQRAKSILGDRIVWWSSPLSFTCGDCISTGLGSAIQHVASDSEDGSDSMACWSQEPIFSADDAGVVGEGAPEVDGLDRVEFEGEQSMDLGSDDDMSISSGDEQEVAPQPLVQGDRVVRSMGPGSRDELSSRQRVRRMPRERVQAQHVTSPHYQEALQHGVFWKYDKVVHEDRDQALYGRVQCALSKVLFVYGEILHIYPSEKLNAGVVVIFADIAAAQRALSAAAQVATEFGACCEDGHGKLLAIRDGFLPKVNYVPGMRHCYGPSYEHELSLQAYWRPRRVSDYRIVMSRITNYG